MTAAVASINSAPPARVGQPAQQAPPLRRALQHLRREERQRRQHAGLQRGIQQVRPLHQKLAGLGAALRGV
jgi:hypothetical protein